jgi:alpha-mannosidase
MKPSFTFLLLFWSFIALSQDIGLKRLYLGNDTHTDLMWNGDEADWYKYNYDMAKFYVKLGEETKDNPPESRSKWNYDVAWTLYMLEKQAPPEFFAKVIEQIKNGQASVPYNFTLPVYGGYSLESVLRSFYYAGHLERKYDIDIDLAIGQENSTIPLGVASLWAGSGAKYSWRGVCNCATKINTKGQRDHEIYWYTGLDGSRILMKWYSNYGWNAELGGYAEMLEPTVAVIQMDTLTESPHYPYKIAAAFGKGWDNIHNYSLDLVWGLKHRTRPGTKLYLSNQSDFFKDFEATYGEKLPEVSVAYGNEWEMGMASLASVSGQLRRSMEKLRTSEALAAIVSAGNPAMLDGFKSLHDDFLYGIGVYNVHGWTADGPINRHDFATYMRKQQTKVSLYVDSLQNFSMMHLGNMINPQGKKDVVFAFNSLNWERDGLVDLPVTGNQNAVRDLQTGKIYTGNLINESGEQRLRVWVEDIPQVGYKLLQRTSQLTTTSSTVFKFIDGQLETPYYTAHISKSGAITSLYDKRAKKMWTNSWLNDLGATEHEIGGEIVIVEQSPDYITLKCESDNPVKHTSEITFFAKDRRIDFKNTILQNFSEILHYTFDFAIDKPEVWHEEVGAVIKAKTASQGGHYADRMARYDYLTLNHFVNVGNQTESITLSNADCLFFKLGDSKPDSLDGNSSIIHILAGGQINENLGIIAQDGDSVFYQHFSILPHTQPFNAVQAMRFALDHQNKLVAANVSATGVTSEKTHSFLKCDNPYVVLWALKPGEEEGTVLRYWNLDSRPTTIRTVFNSPLLNATYTTHVETEISEIPVKGNTFAIGLNKFQMKTFRVGFKH